MKRRRILVVDDIPSTLEIIQRNVVGRGYAAYTAPGVFEAIALLEKTDVDIIITDLKMPKAGGGQLIRYIRENKKDIGIIVMTGYPSIESAVEAVKAGADEYLPKPFTDAELFSVIERVLDKKIEKAGVETSAEQLTGAFGIIGSSEGMKLVYRTIKKAALTPATVLITGESGTGKELVARAIHYQSARANSPFVPVNCGGIPEALMESELFGYVKGAFTGAYETRAGFFQTAEGGTIFLDEIGEMSLAMQIKLLRVLQDKEIRMVGGVSCRTADIRIIAATNRDLKALIVKHHFREELFFRINVITVDIPPLRDRGNDCRFLIEHFLRKYSREFGKEQPQFTDSALDLLVNYRWPGNVRELENVIQRLVIMSEANTIDVSDLPSLMRFSASRGTGMRRCLAEVEAEHIRNILADVQGNKTKAAEILEIDRKTLREKMKRYCIEDSADNLPKSV